VQPMRSHVHIHDLAIRAALKRADPSGFAYSAWLQVRRRKRRGKDKDIGGVPVGPDRPNTLSGGAAAPLEFDFD